MEYKILVNTKFDSKEVYFDGMPSEAIRNGLKSFKFRWNPKKGCWYGFLGIDELKKILEGEKPEKAAEKKPQPKKEKKNKYGVKVGDYFSIVWGYEQTNVDFLQVIALVGETSVRVREVNPPIIERDGVGAMAEDRVYKLDRSKLLPPAEHSVFINDQENGDLKRITDKYTSKPHFYVGSSEQLADLETGETVKMYESWYA